VIDDLIDLILRRELATRAAMSALPAALRSISLAFTRASARRC
jgi:hypothetical protein